MAFSRMLARDDGNMGRRDRGCNAVVLLALLLTGLMMLMTAPATAQTAPPIRIVAFGDSLTAGYGLAAAEAFPVQLEKALKARGHSVEVINAGVSGDTTAGGLDRFDWAVPENTHAVILELGANDALRGLDPDAARRNLDAILTKLKQRGIPVLLAGMRAPRNLGEPYAKKFDGMYPALAEKHGAQLYPFFLDGVALDPKLNLGDGIHPTGAGIALIVERMLPMVEALIARSRKSG